TTSSLFAMDADEVNDIALTAKYMNICPDNVVDLQLHAERESYRRSAKVFTLERDDEHDVKPEEYEELDEQPKETALTLRPDPEPKGKVTCKKAKLKRVRNPAPITWWA